EGETGGESRRRGSAGKRWVAGHGCAEGVPPCLSAPPRPARPGVDHHLATMNHSSHPRCISDPRAAAASWQDERPAEVFPHEYGTSRRSRPLGAAKSSSEEPASRASTCRSSVETGLGVVGKGSEGPLLTRQSGATSGDPGRKAGARG